MKETLKLFYNLYICLDKKMKKEFHLLLILMILTSIFELISISMILPFISFIIEPDKFYDKAQALFNFNQINKEELILIISSLFIISIIIAFIMKIIFLKLNSKFAFYLSNDLSCKIFDNILHLSWEELSQKNSSEIINSITQKVHTTIYGAVLPFLTLLTSIIMSIFIISFLLYINFEVVLYSILVMFIFYILVIKTFKKKLNLISQIIPNKSTESIVVIQESLGHIRDILIDNTQKIFLNKFKIYDFEYKNAQGESVYYSGLPKTILESLLLLVIVIYLYYSSENSLYLFSILPFLATFVLALQKLLPLIQAIYNSWSNILTAKISMIDVIKLIKINKINNLENSLDISFEKSIYISNISYSYDNKIKILDNINLKIKKRDMVGIIGTSGSGKSTLVNIVLGFLKYDGDIFIDDNLLVPDKLLSWKNKISFVPQEVYISNTSIYENIAFGKSYEEIDKQRVHEIAKKIELDEYIQTLPNGYDTLLGERGSFLSGGQRQRIGIGRALYKNASVMILDEITSALDNQTEEKIMNMIKSIEDVTVIMVAHRISSLSICNRIIELEKGKIIRECTYEDLVGK